MLSRLGLCMPRVSSTAEKSLLDGHQDMAQPLVTIMKKLQVAYSLGRFAAFTTNQLLVLTLRGGLLISTIVLMFEDAEVYVN